MALDPLATFSNPHEVHALVGPYSHTAVVAPGATLVVGMLEAIAVARAAGATA